IPPPAQRLVSSKKVTHRCSSPRRRYTVENGRIVAACGDQYEAMPDRVLKPQVLPHVKDDAYRVKDAACREKPKAQARESRCNRLVKDHTTPTQEQVEKNGQAIEATRQQQLESNADNRYQPDTDEETHRNKADFHLRYEWRVGAGDHHVDGRVIEAPQN